MPPELPLLWGLAIVCTGFFLFLCIGHAYKEINLYDTVRSAPPDLRADGRKIARIVALFASTIAYMYCIARNFEVVWMTAIYISSWVAHDLLGTIVQAKGFAITQKAKEKDDPA